MNQRAKEKLFLVNDLFCIILIIGMVGYTFYAIARMPDTIPIHLTNGVVDGWGSKWISLIMPGLLVFMYVLSILFNNHQKRRNQSLALTNWVKLGVVILMAFVNWSFIQFALG